MLYLHCGWPRTGTTSLQTALFEHRDRLADAGLVYPDRWRSTVGLTHHGLAELLRGSLASDDAFDDFARFLADNADRDLLFSAEVLTYWLSPPERQDALLRFLAMIREVMPVRCVWTLRRHDEMMRSLYLLHLLNGSLDTRRANGRTRWARALDDRFAGLRKVEEAAGDDVVYLKYDSRGAHNRQLLRALGVDDSLVATIYERLRAGLRLHAAPTHKQVVALTNVEALSVRAGIAFDEQELRRAFVRGGFAFEKDWPCELIDWRSQVELHELALTAARRHGITSYVEFFAGAEIPDQPRAVGTEAITDSDLQRLTAFLSPPRLRR